MYKCTNPNCCYQSPKLTDALKDAQPICDICKKIPAPNRDVVEWKKWHDKYCKDVNN